MALSPSQLAASSSGERSCACAHSWKNRKSRITGGNESSRARFQRMRYRGPAFTARPVKSALAGDTSSSGTVTPLATHCRDVPSDSVNAPTGKASAVTEHASRRAMHEAAPVTRTACENNDYRPRKNFPAGLNDKGGVRRDTDVSLPTPPADGRDDLGSGRGAAAPGKGGYVARFRLAVRRLTLPLVFAPNARERFSQTGVG